MEKSFTTSDLNKHLGDVLDAASRRPVSITRHGKPRYVLTSAEHFARLKGEAQTRRAFRAETVPADLRNALLASNLDLSGEDQ